jgi:serine protease Do
MKSPIHSHKRFNLLRSVASSLMIGTLTLSGTLVSEFIPTTATRPASAQNAPTQSARSKSPMPANLSDLAESIKPAVVRVISGCQGKAFSAKYQKTYDLFVASSGSGFFINPNGYVVTNAHVTQLVQKSEECKQLLLQDAVEQLIADGTFTRKNLSHLQSIEAISQQAHLSEVESIQQVVLPNGDRLPYTIQAAGAPVGEGKDVAVIKIDVKNAPVLKLADARRVPLMAAVMAVGYPVSAESDVLDSGASLVASFTTGSVSAKKFLADGSPVVQISAPTTHGGSGGPVLNANGEVIGIVTFGGDQQLSGFAFAVAASTIMEFVQQAGIRNEVGPINALYQDAIGLYDQGNFGRALSKFLAVQRLFPQHSEVRRLITDCRRQITDGRVS